jgi:hypothetical protein
VCRAQLSRGRHHALWSVFVTFFVNCLNHMVQEGSFCVGNLSTASEDRLSRNRSKAWHTPVVGLCNGMWCKEWQKGGSLVTDRWWNHYVWIQGTSLCRVYNCHDSRACGYKKSGILFWLDGWMGMGWYLVMPLCNLCDYFVPLCAFMIILCDILKYNLIGVVLTYNFNFRR